MRIVLLTMTALALVACQKTEVAANAEATNDVAVANDAMASNDAMADVAATPAAFEIKGTSWEYIDAKTKKPIQESIDADGKYISTSGAEHMDHGTAVMKDGKACFTSAMTKEGEMCWTDPKIEVGGSGETTSDKGEKLPIKRVAYVAKTM
ncbi:hypothetical protein [Sphingomonas sp.]|uniref:hypothetical protein n=1 Tax=Sphingomonas sp. TaxID=28214 RepID=UPI00286B8916|nr:hypothetical protein [Sphingomonas sp.]